MTPSMRLAAIRALALGAVVALAVALAFTAPAPAAPRPADARLIAYAKKLDVRRIDRALPSESYEAWLRRLVGRRAAIRWEVNDCGEGGDGRGKGPLPVCVEADCRLVPKGRVIVSLGVGDTKRGIAGEPGVFWACILSPGPGTDVTSLHELAAAMRRARLAK